MKRYILIITTVISLGLMMLAAGCAATPVTVFSTSTVTSAVTITGTVPPPGTITTTVVQTIGSQTITNVVTLAGDPPDVPHGMEVFVFNAPCFYCHPIPLGHEGFVAKDDFCGECHAQGPINPNIS
jgi:hypothetical protein